MANRAKGKQILWAGVVLAASAGRVWGDFPMTTVASFDTTNYGPVGLTLSADGSTLYSTTNGGGANNSGTVFSVPVTGGITFTFGGLKAGTMAFSVIILFQKFYALAVSGSGERSIVESGVFRNRWLWLAIDPVSKTLPALIWEGVRRRMPTTWCLT